MAVLIRTLVATVKEKINGERGQMTAELAVIIPSALLMLVIVVNAGMFMAELARFDRITGEVARILVTSSTDPALIAHEVLQETLGYEGGTKDPYKVFVDVEKGGDVFLKKRTLHFRLEYDLFASQILTNASTATGTKTGASSLARSLTRSKTLVIYWSTGL